MYFKQLQNGCSIDLSKCMLMWWLIDNNLRLTEYVKRHCYFYVALNTNVKVLKIFKNLCLILLS